MWLLKLSCPTYAKLQCCQRLYRSSKLMGLFCYMGMKMFLDKTWNLICFPAPLSARSLSPPQVQRLWWFPVLSPPPREGTALFSGSEGLQCGAGTGRYWYNQAECRMITDNTAVFLLLASLPLLLLLYRHYSWLSSILTFLLIKIKKERNLMKSLQYLLILSCI